MRAFVTALAVSVAIVAFPAGSSAQWPKRPTPNTPRLADGSPNLAAPAPRTPDGRPDISGIWNFPTTEYYQNLASRLPPGTVQLTPWAAAVQKQRMDRNHGDDPYSLCLPLGVPRINFRTEVKIVPVSSQLTLFLYETYSGQTFRQIFTDGRSLPNPDEVLPTWLGYSVGRWEGETFVVETNGFRDNGWLSTTESHPHSNALKVTERFRRIDVGNLEITVTIDDRKAYLKPWTNTMVLKLRPDTELIEAFCENQALIVPHLRDDPPPPEPPSPEN